MKILLTFEHGGVSLHFIDVIRMLKHRGHSLYYYDAGKVKMPSHYIDFFRDNLTILSEVGDVNQYDMWFYDLTSWEGGFSPLVPQMEAFNGKLICVCNGDGTGFFNERITPKVREKTLLFMRNTFLKDQSKYHPSMRPKFFVSTCYISNSQDFKDLSIPFREKQKRAIFTGSLTGFSENEDPERYLCRIKVPMALINAGVPCIYRMHNHNPQWKEMFEDRVPAKHRTEALSREDFIKEMKSSMIILALRGNYHTVNRFFEGLASGGLVFTTRFKEDAEFYGHGDPGVHYVEIEWDGSDVVEKAKYYFEHLDEAEIIARNGRKLWEDYSMLDENKILPKKVIDYYVEGMARIGGVQI